MSKMLDALREQRTTAAAEAAALLDGDVTPETLDEVEARHAAIEKLDADIARVEAVEARAAIVAEARADSGVPTVGRAIITSEPMTYAEHGERSFVRDMINATVRNDRQAWDNIHRHMDEVARESRAIDRVDGSGGEFVPPLWLVNEYAQTLRPGRITADLLTKQALPPGTDSIAIPRITTGSQTGIQASDNASTTTRDLVTTSVAAPVRTISGYESVSLQLIEQSPLAGGLDRMVFMDLMQDYDYQLDVQVLNGVGTAGEIYGLLNTSGISSGTYTSGTPTGAAMGSAFTQGISTVAKNRYKGATGIVLHPSTWYWLTGQVDGNNRPLVVPNASGPFNALGTITNPGVAQNVAGTFMGLPVYLDAAMPTVSSNQLPAIIAAFEDTMLFESGVRTRVLPDVGSATLTVRFQVYGYLAIAARYPSGIHKVVGTGMAQQTGY